jgi:hypothetical protein
MKTEITGIGTRDAGTSELSNSKTGTLETGITGGYPHGNLFAALETMAKKELREKYEVEFCVTVELAVTATS